MRSFKDNKNHTWTINITVAAIKRVRALCDIDLYSLVEIGEDGKSNTALLEHLSRDPVLLIDAIYAVCKPEADALGISDEEFGEAMAGDAIDEAAAAFLDELVDFFPGMKRRALKKILEASHRFEEAAKQRLTTILDNGQFDRELNCNVERLLNSYGSAPDTSESIPPT
jgi:hypothetical protein